MFNAIYQKNISVRQADPFFASLFRTADLITAFEFIAVYLIVTGGRAPSAALIRSLPAVQALYTPMFPWLRQCLVDGRPAMPPVSEYQGMAFVDRVLDGTQRHLQSIRASDAAARVSATRGHINDVWREFGSRWVLAPSFSSHIGHLTYAAALITLNESGELGNAPIAMLNGTTRNPALKSRFEPYFIAQMPADISYVELISGSKRYAMRSGRMATMHELMSAASARWTGGAPFLAPDPAVEAGGAAALEKLGVAKARPIVTLHVREAGYNRSIADIMSQRDARIEDYEPAIRALIGLGYAVVRLGDRSMAPGPVIDGFVDYPFSAAKSDWMDLYLASRCDFHIGTSSGMSFVPLLYGRPVLFTNFPTLAHMVCTPATVSLPKVLKTVDGETVPFETFCRDHADIVEVSDAAMHGLVFADNTSDDIARAAVMMVEHLDRDTGRIAFPDTLFSRAASALPTAPQIPDWFVERHYPVGSE